MSNQFMRNSAVVEAVQLLPDNAFVVIQWVHDRDGITSYQCRNTLSNGQCIPEAGHDVFVGTDLGLVPVGVTDWVVNDVDGWKAVKNEKFRKDYTGDFASTPPLPEDPHVPEISPDDPHQPLLPLEPPIEEGDGTEEPPPIPDPESQPEDIPMTPLEPGTPVDPEDPEDIPMTPLEPGTPVDPEVPEDESL